MKLGVHVYAWYSLWRKDPLAVLDRARDMGFEFVEIPLGELDGLDLRALRAHLLSLGLQACASTLLTEATDVTSEHPEVRRRGVEYLKRCVEAAAELGAPFLSGVVYAQHAKPGRDGASPQEWDYAVEALREVARFARDQGMDIGIEPVNRYESHLINTCEQALKLRELVAEPNIKIHLDTYHMVIEEGDFYSATKRAGPHLIHVHLGESHRGVPGTGLVPWDDLFRALRDMGYRGFAAIESVVELSGAWVRRPLAPDADALVREGAAFLRRMMERYGLR